MGNYYSVRVWQLKAQASAAELEELASSGYLEIQRWIPGLKRLSFMRVGGATTRYLFLTTFRDYEAYLYWRQVEEEAPDYWEHYAAVLMQWQELCYLVEEYAGESVLDTGFENSVRD